MNGSTLEAGDLQTWTRTQVLAKVSVSLRENFKSCKNISSLSWPRRTRSKQIKICLGAKRHYYTQGLTATQYFPGGQRYHPGGLHLSCWVENTKDVCHSLHRLRPMQPMVSPVYTSYSFRTTSPRSRQERMEFWFAEESSFVFHFDYYTGVEEMLTWRRVNPQPFSGPLPFREWAKRTAVLG